MLSKTCETTEKKSYMVRGSSTVKENDGTTTTVCTFSTGFDKVQRRVAGQLYREHYTDGSTQQALQRE